MFELMGREEPKISEEIGGGSSIADAYFSFCTYVLCISRYSGFLWVVPTNTKIFLHGFKPCGETRT